ncbi:GNAT family N-acetyltransferase [Candidatus Daviesbacteria bacterium]|nr:GNAT family N-acetyltransferase [Candidatus Daviesbacteria bacterium]
MIIREMRRLDIEAVSLIHKKTIPGPGSKIGKRFLIKFYNLLLSNPKDNISLVAELDGKIVGILVATRNYPNTKKLLNKIYSPEVFIDTLKAIFLGKLGIKELYNHYRFSSQFETKSLTFNPFIAILTLAVDKSFQRKGIGRQLLVRLIRDLSREKIKLIMVDTLLENQQALGFYNKMGFRSKFQLVDSWVLEKVVSSM